MTECIARESLENTSGFAIGERLMVCILSNRFAAVANPGADIPGLFSNNPNSDERHVVSNHYLKDFCGQFATTHGSSLTGNPATVSPNAVQMNLATHDSETHHGHLLAWLPGTKT
jgi:hypothetical protein